MADRVAGATATGTAVDYGTPDFLTLTDGNAFGGGRSFFAGGPGSSDGSQLIQQTVDVSGAAAEIGAGQVNATLGGCLGGFANQDDNVLLFLRWNGGSPTALAPGPDAAERGNVTKLMPVSNTVPVPTNVTSIDFVQQDGRSSGAYNDAYADTLFLVLTPSNAQVPTANCSPVAGGGGGGGGSSGGGGSNGGGGGGSGGGPFVRLLRESATTFPAASTGASIARKRKTGTTISYTDSVAATTTFTVLAPIVGSRASMDASSPRRESAASGAPATSRWAASRTPTGRDRTASTSPAGSGTGH